MENKINIKETLVSNDLLGVTSNLSCGYSSLFLTLQPSQSWGSLLSYIEQSPPLCGKVLDCFRQWKGESQQELEQVYRKRALILEKSLMKIVKGNLK